MGRFVGIHIEAETIHRLVTGAVAVVFVQRDAGLLAVHREGGGHGIVFCQVGGIDLVIEGHAQGAVQGQGPAVQPYRLVAASVHRALAARIQPVDVGLIGVIGISGDVAVLILGIDHIGTAQGRRRIGAQFLPPDGIGGIVAVQPVGDLTAPELFIGHGNLIGTGAGIGGFVEVVEDGTAIIFAICHIAAGIQRAAQLCGHPCVGIGKHISHYTAGQTGAGEYGGVHAVAYGTVVQPGHTAGIAFGTVRIDCAGIGTAVDGGLIIQTNDTACAELGFLSGSIHNTHTAGVGTIRYGSRCRYTSDSAGTGIRPGAAHDGVVGTIGKGTEVDGGNASHEGPVCITVDIALAGTVLDGAAVDSTDARRKVSAEVVIISCIDGEILDGPPVVPEQGGERIIVTGHEIADGMSVTVKGAGKRGFLGADG